MIKFKLDKKFKNQLPTLICMCGHEQKIFATAGMKCAKCGGRQPDYVFKIAKNVDHRMCYHTEDKIVCA